MCGILAFSCGVTDFTLLDHLKNEIKRRGPDMNDIVSARGFTIAASVLSLRMPSTPQPISDGRFCSAYNGEIYNTEGNDTIFFFDLLKQDVRKTQFLEGEFAFIFHDGESLWFGRDYIGRRSLVYRLNESGLVVSSVSGGNQGFQECDAGTLYRFRGGILEISSRPALRELYKCIVHNTTEHTTNALANLINDSVKERMVMPASVESVALLFSGGLDCTLLGYFMHVNLALEKTIDLINVAFENKRANTMWDTPDRLLARRSLEELQDACPGRLFNFIEVNIPYEEAVSAYPIVKDLMWPSATAMDLSIAIAFYFAARGESAECKLASPILISGLGADELFAGYSRHAAAASKGPEQLSAELELDFLRLGSRNLGRDDRVCSRWGREVRYPYLSNPIVEFAFSVPPASKADGVNTKILLRDVAGQIGLTRVCREKKRAIQFGARSAKMDPASGRTKGTDPV